MRSWVRRGPARPPDASEYNVHIGSITHRPLVTTTLPTSVRLAAAMTITGIDSTGKSTRGNVLPRRPRTDAEALDAELLSLETQTAPAVPSTAVPEVGPAPEQQRDARRWL